MECIKSKPFNCSVDIFTNWLVDFIRTNFPTSIVSPHPTRPEVEFQLSFQKNNPDIKGTTIKEIRFRGSAWYLNLITNVVSELISGSSHVDVLTLKVSSLSDNRIELSLESPFYGHLSDLINDLLNAIHERWPESGLIGDKGKKEREDMESQIEKETSNLPFMRWFDNHISGLATKTYFNNSPLFTNPSDGDYVIYSMICSESGGTIPVYLRKNGKFEKLEVLVNLKQKGNSLLISFQYPSELSDLIIRLLMAIDAKYPASPAITESSNQLACPDEEKQKPSSTIRLPKRPADLRRWKQTWRVTRGVARDNPNLKEIVDWLERMHPKLSCKVDTMRDIIHAGEAHLLED